MVDDGPEAPERRSGIGVVLRAIESLRTDIREDMVALDGRLMDAVHEVRRDQAEYVAVHGGAHGEMMGKVEILERFQRESEIAEAKREGALGIARFLLEHTARNAPRLIGIVLSLAAAIGFLSGTIRIVVVGS